MNNNMSEYNVKVDTLDTVADNIVSASDKINNKLEEANRIMNMTLSEDCFSGPASDSIKDSWNLSSNLTMLDVATLKNASRLKNIGSGYVSSDKKVSTNISNIEVLK